MAGGITIDNAVELLARTDRHRIRGDFTKTQNLTQYTVCDLLVNGQKPRGFEITGTAIEKRVQLRDNAGSTQNEKMYEQKSYTIGPALTKMVVERARSVNKGEVYEKEELKLENTEYTRLVSLMDDKEATNSRDTAEFFESKFLFPRQNSSDTEGWQGILEWARPSMTSGGSYTANTDGGFVGQYVRYGDATASATLAAIDASTAENLRWRNWASSRINTRFTYEVAKQVKRAYYETNFQSGEFIRQDGKNAKDKVLLFNTTDYEDYENLTSEWRLEAKGDLFAKDMLTLKQMEIKRTPSLNQDTTNSIIGMALNCIGLVKADDWGTREGPFIAPGAEWTIGYRRTYRGQIVCDDPRGGLFRIHGSF